MPTSRDCNQNHSGISPACAATMSSRPQEVTPLRPLPAWVVEKFATTPRYRRKSWRTSQVLVRLKTNSYAR